MLLSLSPALLRGQPGDEDYKVYSDPPRLLLTKQRLRLLQREKERQSVRWQQFDTLVSSGMDLPEPGFSLALEYQAAGNAPAGRAAVEWAVSEKATDLRQLALVFDWCGPVMTPAQNAQLVQKIQRLLNTPAGDDAQSQSARALAAIAISDKLPDLGEKILKGIVEDWWRAKRLKNLDAGRPPLKREETYAAYELLHALRDNLKIDLREYSAKYFEKFPIDHVVSHYPPALSGTSNDYRIPAYIKEGNPDTTEAVLSRAAEFAMVAFDNNSQESQFVQGWLMDDRFMMRDALGASYEFLWANPYQPGLSFTHLPLVFHDEKTGRIFARTSWDEDATWIGFFDGQLQLFRDGKIQVLKAGSAAKPVRVGDVVLLTAPTTGSDGFLHFSGEAESSFLLGLAPATHYDVEIDDQQLLDQATDVGGTLKITLAPETQAGIRLRKH